MELSIIIVNWNSKEYLRKCLDSIGTNTSQVDHEVLVIDAASYDGTDKMLADRFPNVRFLQAERNLGFARANNAAFELAIGQFVLFLNPDTEVIGSALSAMIDGLRTLPYAGSVGCRLLNSDGTVQTSCIQSVPTILNQVLDSEFLRARWPQSPLWGMAALFNAGEEPSVVEAISGACVMLKREVFERVGRFSEDYFMYAEDIDLSCKLSQAGYLNYYLPSATVLHHGGGSAVVSGNDFSSVMVRQSIWLFLNKTRGRAYGIGYRVGMLFVSIIRLLLLVGWCLTVWIRGGTPSMSRALRKWCAIVCWTVYPRKWLIRSSEPLLSGSRAAPSGIA